MFDEKKYKHSLQYPERPSSLSHPNLSTASPQEIREFAYKKEIYEKEMAIFNEKLRKFNEEEALIKKKFKEDVLRETGFIDHPNADRIFNYAWEEAHAEGYENVFNCLEELNEIFFIMRK